MNVVLLISALLASSLGLALKGCSPGNRPGKELVESDAPAGPASAVAAAENVAAVQGVFTFEDVSATANADGTVGPTVTRLAPVRFAQVVALDGDAANPTQLTAAPVFTDANGVFTLTVPQGTPFRPMLVLSTVGSGRGVEVRTLAGRASGLTVTDGGQPFVVPAGTTSLQVAIDPFRVDAPGRPAGALNILDAATTGVDSAVASLGTTLPTAVFLYDPASTEGSFFRSFDPAVNGPAITIQGGDAVNDDTDEFDDAVILHELGHFVAHATSKDSSLGGEHSISDAANPALAWSEGFATFFAGLVTANPVWISSSAILGATGGFTINLETRTPDLGARGVRSELSVGEILWDLVDGAEGRPNADAEDSVVTASQLFAVLRQLRGTNAYVSLNDVLQLAVTAGLISTANLNALLDAPEDQNLDFPPAAADVFPTRVVANAVALRDVAETRVRNGAGSDTEDVVNRFYLIDLAAEASLTITLALDAPADGRNASGTNLDLVLLTDDNADARDTSGIVVAGKNRSVETNPERVPITGASPRLAAGRYIIWVTGRADRTGGARNATAQVVPFSLTVGP